MLKTIYPDVNVSWQYQLFFLYCFFFWVQVMETEHESLIHRSTIDMVVKNDTSKPPEVINVTWKLVKSENKLFFFLLLVSLAVFLCVTLPELYKIQLDNEKLSEFSDNKGREKLICIISTVPEPYRTFPKSYWMFVSSFSTNYWWRINRFQNDCVKKKWKIKRG